MTEDILVVGGGTGGTVVANRLADELAADIDAGDVTVTLLSDSPDHVYKPVFLYVAFGMRRVDDGRRPIRDLLNRRVRFHLGRAVAVDPEEGVVRVAPADGGVDDALAYDHLVLATGSRLAPEEIPGLEQGGHHFYSPDGAETLREAMAEFTEGRLVLSVMGVPHMCPVAPVEFVLMADEWLRDRGRREDVDLVYTYPIQRAHAIPSIAEWASEEFERRDVELRTFVNPEAVDVDASTVHTMEGDEIAYDLLVAIPPHRGVDLIIDSGLGEDGWVPVDRHTLEATDHDGVYAVGDTADVPTSKAGSVAHYQAGVVADRIASNVRGETPTARYDGKTVCFLEAGLDRATFVEFSYGEVPSVPPPTRALHWGKLAYNESYWLTARGLL